VTVPDRMLTHSVGQLNNSTDTYQATIALKEPMLGKAHLIHQMGFFLPSAL